MSVEIKKKRQKSLCICPTDETKPWAKSVSEPAPKSLFLAPSCVAGLENTSGDSLSQLGVQNKDLGGVTSMTQVIHSYAKTKIAELLTKNELEHCSMDIARVCLV